VGEKKLFDPNRPGENLLARLTDQTRRGIRSCKKLTHRKGGEWGRGGLTGGRDERFFFSAERGYWFGLGGVVSGVVGGGGGGWGRSVGDVRGGGGGVGVGEGVSWVSMGGT